jgi:hypothetical protein
MNAVKEDVLPGWDELETLLKDFGKKTEELHHRIENNIPKYQCRHNNKRLTAGCINCQSYWEHVCRCIEQEVNLSHQFGYAAFWSIYSLVAQGKRDPIKLVTPEMRRYQPKCLNTFAKFENVAYKSPRKMRVHRRK